MNQDEEKTFEERLKERGGERRADGTISTPLLYPIKTDSREIKEITLRRVCIDDLETVDAVKTGFGRSRKMITLLTGLAPDEVGRMDGADFNFLSEAIDGFLE